MKYLSFGAGVQTTAILFMYPQIKFDEVVFADTGAESPETYQYLENYSIPFMRDNNIKFTIVKGSELNGKLDSLEGYCLYYRMTPSIQYRWCTEKYKIKAIERYIKSVLPKPQLPATAIMGISWDEYQRMHKPNHAWQINEYPLVDMKITRDQCKAIIISKGYPLPPKSGCFFCPYQSIDQWRILYENHPDFYDRAIKIEENNQQFPKFKLRPDGMSLRKLRNRFGYGNHTIEEYEVPCETAGYCHI